MRLARTRQCDKCPWKVSTNPFDIPRGYDPDKHLALSVTVAEPGILPRSDQPLHMMACHEHPIGKEAACVGWLVNQLGPGNNFGLRIQYSGCENLGEVVLDGEQHECFEDTLPWNKAKK